MFPIGDENRPGHVLPYVTWALIAANVAVFLYELQLGPGVDAFIMQWGAIPARVIAQDGWASLFSSMFIHAGFAHIFGNMLFLLIFGDNVEDALGHARFFLFYIVVGLCAHASFIYFNSTSTMPTVGASGAISGVLGAYMLYFPRNKVRVFWIIFITNVPAWVMIGLWAVQQFLATQAAIAETAQTGGIAYAAHLGGFIAGIVLGALFQSSRRDRGVVGADPAIERIR